MTTLAGVAGALPPNRYSQAELTHTFAEFCLGPGADTEVLQRLHNSAKVRFRHLALPLERYSQLDGFGEANSAFITAAVELGARALTDALDAAGVPPQEVDFITSATTTGICVPSIEARVAQVVGLRPDVVRVPMFGLGCVAGAAGVARLHDYLTAHPSRVGVLLSVELCSLTVQRSDRSVANLVASGLFGDGAAAVVAFGAERAARPGSAQGPRVLDSRSHLYPDTQRAMGWDVSGQGLKIVLDAQVPTIVNTYLADDVTGFLDAHQLKISDVKTWVSHPGGPKVIEAIQNALDLDADALAFTWRSLAEVGNLSSASVLHVLRDTLTAHPAGAGEPALLMAMGPGFCAELVLLEW